MEALTEYRRQLNQLDEQLVELLGRRFAICREVANFKRAEGIPMMQPSRVEEVKARVAAIAARYEVDPGFVRALYGAIIDEACRLEDEIIGHALAARDSPHS
jgi:chorismate mutase-like protein